MANVSSQKLRTVVVVGHSHDGKTSLCEALLHCAGATQRMGSTDAGTSLFDFEPEEQRRSLSIGLAVAHCDWKNYRVNLLDAPGFQDFAGEVAAGIAAADAAVMVVNAGGVVPVGADLAWDMIRAAGLPALICINKMDKENAAYEATVDALREAFARKPIAVAVPIGSGDTFAGVVDLVDDHAHTFGPNGASTPGTLPEDHREEIERAHTALVDAVAETDDALLEKYLGGTELTDDEIRDAMHAAAARGVLIPIIPVSATEEKGSSFVLDCITRYMPGPAERTRHATDAGGKEVEVDCDPTQPFLAQVFKTTIDSFGRVSYVKVLRGTLKGGTPPVHVQSKQDDRFAQLAQPAGKALESAGDVVAGDIAVLTKLVHAHTGDSLADKSALLTATPIAYPSASYSAAIAAKSKGDEDKIMASLTKQAEEDPTFSTDRDPLTHQVLVHGLGDVHLAVALERMKRKYGVEADLHAPRIAYRETITGTARVQHRYKKQSGGAGMYGDCTIEIEPLPRGGGFQWEDKIFGGSIPQQFRPSVEKGVRQTMEQGAVSGNPIVDVKVRLVDGSTHPVDGKDLAFQLAGSMAMREAVQQAKPVLLEPVMEVHVVVPDAQMGDVMGLFNGRRGKVGGMNPLGDGRSEVTAVVPQSEMYTFPIDLRAMTQGRGRYSMKMSHYDEVPANVAQEIIAAHAREPASASV